MRTLKDGPDLDGELLAASVALEIAVAARDGGRPVNRAAVPADPSIGPEQAFEPCAGLCGILENLVVQRVRSGHGLVPSFWKEYGPSSVLSQIYNPPPTNPMRWRALATKMIALPSQR